MWLVVSKAARCDLWRRCAGLEKSEGPGKKGQAGGRCHHEPFAFEIKDKMQRGRLNKVGPRSSLPTVSVAVDELESQRAGLSMDDDFLNERIYC